MVCLSAIKPGWVFVRYREVDVGEIICRLRGDGLKTGIEDRFVGIVVKEGLADFRKGRLRDRVVLLLEEESDDIARFSTHRVGLEGNLVWSRATEGDLPDLGFPGSSECGEDEGKRSETSSEHFVGWVARCKWVPWSCLLKVGTSACLYIKTCTSRTF